VLDAKGLEVNESMLTGESAAVDKAPGDTIYAATTVVAGTAHARVTAVGSATKAGAISTVLKQYAPQPTPLQRAIQRAITVLTYGAVVLALLIFARYHFAGLQAVSILKTIITAAITVVPEGLRPPPKYRAFRSTNKESRSELEGQTALRPAATIQRPFCHERNPPEQEPPGRSRGP